MTKVRVLLVEFKYIYYIYLAINYILPQNSTVNRGFNITTLKSFYEITFLKNYCLFPTRQGCQICIFVENFSYSKRLQNIF